MYGNIEESYYRKLTSSNDYINVNLLQLLCIVILILRLKMVNLSDLVDFALTKTCHIWATRKLKVIP